MDVSLIRLYAPSFDVSIPTAKPSRYIDRPTVPNSAEELNAEVMSSAAEE